MESKHMVAKHMSVQRLTDPMGLLKEDPEKLARVQTKVNRVLTKMYRRAENGGNPFLFALAFSKKQILADKLPGMPKFDTAATDGITYYWSADFLDNLSENEVSIVMNHEIYHCLFSHCLRLRGKKMSIFNTCIDYSVNNTIEEEWEKAGRDISKMWGEKGLSAPLLFQTYLDYIDGVVEEIPKFVTFVDATVRSRTPESLYDELLEHINKSPRKCNDCGALAMDPKTGLPVKQGPYQADECQTCGTPFNGRGREMDHHIDSKLSKQEVQEEMNRAAEQVKALRGILPSQIESLLNQLNNPQLKASDLIRNARFNFKLNQGNLNDYKRLRRRGLGYATPLYQWKKKEYASEWVTLLDTSGSMSDADIANGVKELQLVGGDGHGWIVPCDAEPHWNAMVEVNSKTDIQRTKVVGRGGTVFDAFFKGLKDHFPKGFDSVIVITDGDCGNIDIKLKPPCEVVWVITNQREFKPTFGRVCYLNPA